MTDTPAAAAGPRSEETIHPLPGLEADNLLAFLALLGLLRALDVARPEWRARAAWRGAPPRAELHLRAAAAADDMLAAVNQGMRTLGAGYVFDRGNITYRRAEYRAAALDARGDRHRADLFAALACDAVLKRDDTVQASPLCAMFGQGHQDFLSRLAGAAARAVANDVEDLRRALFETWTYDEPGEGFRWDPNEDRRYALQFGDPSDQRNKIGTVAGANRLAAIGFAILACAPVSAGSAAPRLAAVGVGRTNRDQVVCWPLPAVPTSLSGHLALLAHPDIGDEAKAVRLKAYGVAAVSRSRRYQVGKFFNFERARLQIL